ncbi:unnamed protein product [Rotaria sordida]|uniref:Uncharacterized protein n=1 Tax=Rotaria sordida TaxID=392033 RepID=A0A815Z5R2_9BILA|nr:unnamed protein product [Rotaria sordida]CAF1580017.1 unnamed protein product [Rotaria sordida]
MISKTILTPITDYTNNDKSNNDANYNDPTQTNSLSSYTASYAYDSDAELVQVREVHHQNNNKTNSKSNENVLSDTTNETKLLHSSTVWQYAVREDNRNYATCCLCPDNKRISTNNGSTTTLRKHLISKHNKFDLILPNNKRKHNKTLFNPIKKQQLHHMLISCIIRDGRTFNDFEKAGIKKILQILVPNYEPPNRFAVAHHLKRLNVFHHKQLIDQLTSVNSISLTMDLWSNRQMRCFLVITGHYFAANKFDLQSTVLNFSTFDKQHSGVEISRTLQSKLQELNILQKVVGVTCDGGKNIIRAIDDLNLNVKRVWCVAHRLHLTITNGLGFWVVKKETDEENIIIQEEQGTNVVMNDQEEEMLIPEEFQNNNKMDITDGLELDDNEFININHDDNDEELISDAVDDEIMDNWTEGVNESDVDFIYDQEIIICLMQKCRGLISMIKRSTIITLFFDTERKKQNIKRNLCYDVKSRWNSTYCMIDSFLYLRELIEKLFNYKHHLHLKPKQLAKLSGFEFTSNDWMLLSQLHLVLRPFFHATKAMSGRRYPSMGIAFYFLTRLKYFLQHHDKKESLMVKHFKQLLLAKFLYYFETDDDQMSLLKVHAYFDPAGFATLTDVEKRSVEQSIKIMVADETSYLTELTTTSLRITTTNTTNESNLHEKSSTSAIDLFNEAIGETAYEGSTISQNTKATIINDIYNYRNCVTRFNLKHKPDIALSSIFWQSYGQQFPILGKLAQKMLSTPSTSVPSESCFSVSAFLGRKERGRLTGENLSSSVFLKDKITL